eukprot:4676378-Amphidinium_carterae.5
MRCVHNGSGAAFRMIARSTSSAAAAAAAAFQDLKVVSAVLAQTLLVRMPAPPWVLSHPVSGFNRKGLLRYKVYKVHESVTPTVFGEEAAGFSVNNRIKISCMLYSTLKF